MRCRGADRGRRGYWLDCCGCRRQVTIWRCSGDNVLKLVLQRRPSVRCSDELPEATVRYGGELGLRGREALTKGAPR